MILLRKLLLGSLHDCHDIFDGGFGRDRPGRRNDVTAIAKEFDPLADLIANILNRAKR
jgi:hypothetical protein